jgi:hypothetical protein
MPNPVVELIAQELAARVATVTEAVGYHQTLSVVRPNGTQRDVAPDNNRAVIYQNDPEPAEHSPPGNPPLVSFRQTFYVVVYIRPSEADATAIDTLINRAAADVVRAVRSSSTWHTFGGHAYNAAIGATMQFEHEDQAHDGIVIPFDVWYRQPENDPYYLWTPLDLPGDAVYWLAADSGDLRVSPGGAAVSDGGLVGYWPAAGGGGQYAETHSNGSAVRPTWLANGIGGRPAVVFDANNECLEIKVANSPALFDVFKTSPNHKPLMIALAMQFDEPGDGNNRAALGIMTTAGNGCGVATNGGSADRAVLGASSSGGNGINFSSANASLVAGAAQTLIAQLSDNASFVWIDGALQGSNTTELLVAYDLGQNVCIGMTSNYSAAGTFRGRIAEIVVTHGALWTVPDRAQWTRYVNAKYGIG